LAHLKSDGSLNTSFGTGGYKTFSLGRSSTSYAMSLQADGKLVIAGGGIQTSNSADNDFAVMRLNADGSSDTTFGNAGISYVSLRPSSNSELARALVIQPDGKIIVAGRATNDAGVIRLNANGSLDTSFAETGKAVISLFGFSTTIYGTSLQSDGKILLTGNGYLGDAETSEGVMGVVRLNTDGSLDRSFGTNGAVLIKIGETNDGLFYSAIQRSNGKIVVSGYKTDAITGPNYIAVQLNENGSKDTSFGTAGEVLIPGGTGRAATLLSDGKLLISGGTFVPYGTPAGGVTLENSFSSVRLEVDGRLDTTFNPTPSFTENSTPVG
jgi:uncharacterized delta-60 repeat protein